MKPLKCKLWVWTVAGKQAGFAALSFFVRAPSFAAEVKSTETVGPVLIHVVTEKGRGYLPAETASDKMHGVTQYDTVSGKQVKAGGKVRGSARKFEPGTLTCTV